MLDTASQQVDGTPAATTAAPANTRARVEGNLLLDVVRAVRPYQWVKNLLLFVPILMSHKVQDHARVTHAVLGFVAFCLCASASYVINDLRDREHDRHHPVKRRRPFAAGRLSGGIGAVMALALLAAGIAIAVLRVRSDTFTAMLVLYTVITTAYSLWLKSRLLLDVFFLAGLYTLRVLAGGAAANVEVSQWLLAFCIFFFLSLAYAKRYAELLRVQGEGPNAQLRGRAYRVEDLEIMSSVGPASGYLSVLVLALYVNQSTLVPELYRSPWMLWLLCPVMLYWITRVWFHARRRSLTEDPILFAMKDRVSILTVITIGVILYLATRGVPGLG